MDAAGKTVNAAIKLLQRAVQRAPAGGLVVLDQPHPGGAALVARLAEAKLGESCVQRCHPEGGRLQCLWANEWAMAEMAQDEAAWQSHNALRSYLPLADTIGAASLVYPPHWQRALAPWVPCDLSEINRTNASPHDERAARSRRLGETHRAWLRHEYRADLRLWNRTCL